MCAPEALQPACCRTIFGIWRVKQDSKGTLEDVLRVRRPVSSSSLLRRLLFYNHIPASGILLLSTKRLGLRWLQHATVDLRLPLQPGKEMVAAGYCLYGEACAACLTVPALVLGWVDSCLCQRSCLPALAMLLALTFTACLQLKYRFIREVSLGAGSNCAMVLSIGEGCSVFTLDPSLGEFVLTEPAVSRRRRSQTSAHRQGKRTCKWNSPGGPFLAARLGWAARQQYLTQSSDCHA